MIGELEINQLRLESAKIGLLVQAIIERLGLPKDYPITGKTNLVDLPGFNYEILKSMSVNIAGKEIDFEITPEATVEDFSKALMIQGDFQQTTYHKIGLGQSDPDQNIINKENFFPKILPTEHIIGYPVPHLDPDLIKKYGLNDEQNREYFKEQPAKPEVGATAVAEVPVGGQEPVTSEEKPVFTLHSTDLHAGSALKEAIEAFIRIFSNNKPRAEDGQEPDESPDQVKLDDNLETTQ